MKMMKMMKIMKVSRADYWDYWDDYLWAISDYRIMYYDNCDIRWDGGEVEIYKVNDESK